MDLRARALALLMDLLCHFLDLSLPYVQMVRNLELPQIHQLELGASPVSSHPMTFQSPIHDSESCLIFSEHSARECGQRPPGLCADELGVHGRLPESS